MRHVVGVAANRHKRREGGEKKMGARGRRDRADKAGYARRSRGAEVCGYQVEDVIGEGDEEAGAIGIIELELAAGHGQD